MSKKENGIKYNIFSIRYHSDRMIEGFLDNDDRVFGGNLTNLMCSIANLEDKFGEGNRVREFCKFYLKELDEAEKTA